MSDVTKMLEEADHLATTLNFIKRCCRNCECEECYFSDDEADCLLAEDPGLWDIDKMMLNVGRVIGRREND